MVNLEVIQGQDEFLKNIRFCRIKTKTFFFMTIRIKKFKPKRRGGGAISRPFLQNHHCMAIKRSEPIFTRKLIFYFYDAVQRPVVKKFLKEKIK